MKRIVLAVIMMLLVLSLSGATAVLAMPEQAANAGKAKAPDLDKMVFIHWKKDYVKPQGVKPSKVPTCYKLMRVKLPITTGYAINPTNNQALSESYIGSAIFNGAEAWDDETSKELLSNSVITDYNADYGVRDNINAIVFGTYPQNGVIAVTSVWYNPATKAIVEFDMMFNDYYKWGDAAQDSSLMDLQNIATHEFGHAVGMADVYDSACAAVTMYGYSTEGETDKITLEPPDIAGLVKMYGE